MKKLLVIIMILLLNAFLFASEGNAPHLDGAELSILWVIPFVGILLSIAIFPLIAPHFWHQNFGKISAFWSVLFIGPFLLSEGFSITIYEILHVGFLEYIPFIILLLSYLHLLHLILFFIIIYKNMLLVNSKKKLLNLFNYLIKCM